jgi:ATP synthase protein I
MDCEPMSQKPVEQVKGWTNYSAGALEMGISVVVGLAIGAYLDEKFDTSPWMALIWLTAGTAAGIRSLYRLAKKLEREDAAEASEKDRKNDREG